MNAQIIETLSVINNAQNHFGWVNLTKLFKELNALNYALSLVHKGYVSILQNSDKELYRLNGNDDIFGRLTTKGKDVLEQDTASRANRFFSLKYKFIYFAIALAILLLRAVSQKEEKVVMPKAFLHDSFKIELDSSIKNN